MLEINNTTKQPVNLRVTQAIVARFLRAYRKTSWAVSLAIVGDAKIRKINRRYRKIDKVTDVLSFGGESFSANSKKMSVASKYLGEVIINIQEAARIGKYKKLWEEIGWLKKPTTNQVFYFLLVHGLLHLVGYDDETLTARKKMLRLGEKFLRSQTGV